MQQQQFPDTEAPDYTDLPSSHRQLREPQASLHGSLPERLVTWWGRSERAADRFQKETRTG